MPAPATFAQRTSSRRPSSSSKQSCEQTCHRRSLLVSHGRRGLGHSPALLWGICYWAASGTSSCEASRPGFTHFQPVQDRGVAHWGLCQRLGSAGRAALRLCGQPVGIPRCHTLGHRHRVLPGAQGDARGGVRRRHHGRGGRQVAEHRCFGFGRHSRRRHRLARPVAVERQRHRGRATDPVPPGD